MKISDVLKSIFQFLSSVRLAIPVMLVWIVVIAYGTIVESQYNSELAKLKVYHHPLFSALIVLIWINVLFAALSRWPWKKHHTGFLITHLGLLMLFAGGLLTNLFGTDGMLRIEEGGRGDRIFLPDLVLSIQKEGGGLSVEYPIQRGLNSLSQASLFDLNEKVRGLLSIEAYEPFVEMKTVKKRTSGGESGGAVDIQFNLESQFFNVDQSLNSVDQPELRMGPALFRLRPLSARELALKSFAKNPAKDSRAVRETLGHLKVNVGPQVKDFDLARRLPISISFEGYSIQVKSYFSKAEVGKGGIRNNPDGQSNPALEVQITKNGKQARDVLFARYPRFSLRKNQFEDLTFEFSAAGSEAARGPDVGSGEQNSGNQIFIYYPPETSDSVIVDLLKDGKRVMTQSLKQGEILQTPWMGMKLKLTQIQYGVSQDVEIIPTQPQERNDALPPSALRLAPFEGAPADEVWLVEGQQMQMSSNGGNYVITYGRRQVRLPFELTLESFRKIDYPGTGTPKSFESTVRVSDQVSPVIISMNEPFHSHSYTVYQSSFEAMDGGRFASIFSVNKDPGRPFKYLGGIFLAIGIVVFTMMRSRRFRKGNS